MLEDATDSSTQPIEHALDIRKLRRPLLAGFCKQLPTVESRTQSFGAIARSLLGFCELKP